MPKKEEEMNKQAAPEKDVVYERLQDEIRAKIEEDKNETEEEKDMSVGEIEQAVKDGDNKKLEDSIREEKAVVKDIEETVSQEPTVEEDAGEQEDAAGPSEQTAKEIQEAAEREKRKFDNCPFCGTHSMQGSLQPKIPLPGPDGQMYVIGLPLLACVRCSNVYIPRSYINELLNPKTEKPKIIRP